MVADSLRPGTRRVTPQAYASTGRLQSFGVYPATFLYDDSVEYKHALTDCKDEQKEMIQCEEACYCKTVALTFVAVY